jgi:hypothetical protein
MHGQIRKEMGLSRNITSEFTRMDCEKPNKLSVKTIRDPNRISPGIVVRRITVLAILLRPRMENDFNVLLSNKSNSSLDKRLLSVLCYYSGIQTRRRVAVSCAAAGIGVIRITPIRVSFQYSYYFFLTHLPGCFHFTVSVPFHAFLQMVEEESMWQILQTRNSFRLYIISS